jgi:hypothetical protein
MKWIVLEEDLKKDEVDKSEWGNYKVYKNKTDLEADVYDPDKFNVWAHFSSADLPENVKLNRKSQRKYEIYVGGFLFYHDDEFKRYPKGIGFSISNGVPIWKEYPDWRDYLKSKEEKNEPIYDTGSDYFEHHIYIEWNKKEKSVKIYINKTPDEYNVDPPKPPAPPPPES